MEPPALHLGTHTQEAAGPISLNPSQCPLPLPTATNIGPGVSQLPLTTISTPTRSRTATAERNLPYTASVGRTTATSVPARQPLAPLSLSSQNAQPKQQPGLNAKPFEKIPFHTRASLRRSTSQWLPKTPSLRRPIQELPVPLRVYFMPDGRHVHQDSIIHRQKRQNGFFLHPILVIRVDERLGIVHFYALTSNPPDAIRDLGIYLRFGTTTANEGEDILKLAKDSDRMQQVTFVNMEQLFRVECQFLDYWRANVTIDISEWAKIERKVNWLEAEQNRYIYKPLQRDMKDVVPGVILMLPNPPESSTLGAPILVLEVNYPHFRFLRVKEVNGKVNLGGAHNSKATRNPCLRLCRYPDHANDAVLFFEPDSPSMRNPSYLECSKKLRWVHCDHVKTWSYPHVRIQAASMNWLLDYLAKLPEPPGIYTSEPTTILHSRSIPQPPQIRSPQSTTMFHPYTAPPPTNTPYSQHGFWYPAPVQPNAISLYGHQAAMSGNHTLPYNGYGTYLPPVTLTPIAYPPGWGYHQPSPSVPLTPSIGRTAYATSSRCISATSYYTVDSRSSSRDGPCVDFHFPT